MKLYEFMLAKSYYKHLSDPPFIMSPCMCYGQIVVMETDSTQNFKYNQKYLLL